MVRRRRTKISQPSHLSNRSITTSPPPSHPSPHHHLVWEHLVSSWIILDNLDFIW